jgi:hypothetical protein
MLKIKPNGVTMLRNLVSFLALTIIVSGCSSPAPESVTREPGSYTELTVTAFSDLWLDGVVQLAPKDKRGCGEFSKNLLTPPLSKDFNTDVDGNRDVFFHINRSDSRTSCDRVGIFYAIKGNSYTLKLVPNNNQCEISLIEQNPNGIQKTINTYPAHKSIVNGKTVCLNKDKLY